MKSNRRSVLIGLGALTVGGGAVFGTGAFSSVEAERDVSVEVANDDEAFIAIDVHSDSSGSEFVEVNNSGQRNIVEFDFSGDDEQDGLNDEATTNFHNLITITNNGSNQVDLNIEAQDDNGTEVANGFTAYEGESPESPIVDETLDSTDPGNQVDVGFQFDTVEATADELESIETILISAEDTE